MLFKEVSKPIANKIKSSAHTHPYFRGIAISLGHNYEVGVQHVDSLIAGRGRLSAVKPVSEAQAFTVGTDLITQGVLLSAALGFLLFEYWRASEIKEAETIEKAAKKAARQAIKEARFVEIERTLASLSSRLTVTELEIESIRSHALELSTTNNNIHHRSLA